MTDSYSTGDIVDFPYLWAWQASRGETEGRKDRPCCIALVARQRSGKTRIYLLPITTTPPSTEDPAMPVPQIEARRAGLDDDRQQWVILSELNTDVLEDSYYLDRQPPLGRFSKAFLHKLLDELRQIIKAGSLKTIHRND